MTATPIPRTLAIAFFGSLDLSILDEMPKNRKPIITRIVLPAQRDQIYAFMRKEIDAGRQVFVILPLVEESKVLTEVKAVTEEHKKLSEIFPEYHLGLLHGRLKSKEKETVMQDFKDKKSQILVSTSVVEVGIDIPNATIMLIENSDRFGLSQLHQFRGRVGRGEHQSYCFLFTDSATKTALERMRAMEKSNDGFELSEIDLKLRGPGQLLGKSQSGFSDIAMENLNNLKLIKLARAEAQNIFKTDSKLKKHPLIAKALEKFAKDVHLE
jgi:ATP-dependent DNA helicase RecG